MPDGQVANDASRFQYDTAGNPLSSVLPAPSESDATQCASGAGLPWPAICSSCGQPVGITAMANGYAIPVGGGSFDARSDQLVAQSVIGYMTAGAQTTYSYDAAGREVDAATPNCTVNVSTPNPDPALPPTTTTAQGGDSIARSYDAQNHLVSEATTLAAGAAAVCPGASATTEQWTWGLEGHPWSYNSGRSVEPPISLHWDGSALLYATQANGTSTPTVTLSIGKLGEVQLGSDAFNAPYAIVTIDRDESGAQVQFHADDYFSAFAPPGAFLQHLVRLSLPNGTTRTLDWNPYPASSAWGPNDLSFAPIGMARTDGYQMGDVTIQGVRAYDPSIAQWVSPDAYAGTTTDPGSQKPFMWDGNNPIAYSDPSGYCIEDGCVGEAAAVVVVEGGGEVVAVGADAVGDAELANDLRSGVDSFNRGAWQKLEQMGNWVKGRFEALDGTKRIADNLSEETGKIGESKSMNYVSLTKQIRDYIGYAQKTVSASCFVFGRARN